MIFPRSVLISCCLAAVLLFSLWASSAQNFWTQDVLENAEIVLTLDAGAHTDDSFEQIALIPGIPPAIFVPHHASYPQQPAASILSDCFPPPDRPPAKSV